jgi:hypothetical protein
MLLDAGDVGPLDAADLLSAEVEIERILVFVVTVGLDLLVDHPVRLVGNPKLGHSISSRPEDGVQRRGYAIVPTAVSLSRLHLPQLVGLLDYRSVRPRD